MEGEGGVCDALSKLDIKPVVKAPQKMLVTQSEVKSPKKAFVPFKARAVPISTYVRPAVTRRILSTKLTRQIEPALSSRKNR